ncbi:MAG: hypothetical protein WD875_12620 [Pirellulales bacterium]
MARKLVIALVVVCLFSSDAVAERRGGFHARWAARRAARAHTVELIYATPQAAWNARYRAGVRNDWETTYRCLDRDSREQCVANMAFGVLRFSNDDDDWAEVADHLARRHRLDFRAMAREFNETYKSPTPDPYKVTALFDDRSPAFSKAKQRLLRHISDHDAFYRDAMHAIFPGYVADEPNTALDVPELTNLRINGNHAKAAHRSISDVSNADDVPGQTVEFTFENGGWKVRKLDW